LQDGEVIAGHTRLLAAEALGLDRVPVRYVDLDPSEARLLAIADNRLGEIATWDDGLLASILAEYSAEDAALAGWDAADLDQLLDSLKEPSVDDAGAQVDKADELQRKWGTRLGQTWKLGAHRLLIGDCAQHESFGAHCETLFFDPPWDAMPRMAPRASVLAFADGQRTADVVRLFGAPTWVFAWDCVSSWYTPSRPLKRMKLALWYGALESYDFDGAHYGDAGEERAVENSRGAYKFKPDPRGKHLSDLYSQPITKLHSESEHSHSKPIDWIRMLIGNCTKGDVYDPFCGSGTSIMACEQLGRRCYAVEIDPKFAAVIIDRWATATGGAPEVENG
jgi:hypothetical protein